MVLAGDGKERLTVPLPPGEAGAFSKAPMDSLLASTLLVAFAEIGDKTMLLAIILAARFRAPWPIIAGIFAATIVNHALAAWAGSAISGLLDGRWFRLAVAIGFLAMAVWILVPDQLDEDEEITPGRYGVFVTTTIAFFMAEMGDKTQIATVALGARYHSVELVAIGTTLGMMIANVPAVFLGDRITRIIRMRTMRIGAAIIFVLLGALAIWELLG